MLKVKIYAELAGNCKKYRIKSLYDNKTNNFATTEQDIVSMANRLAASGTLAGLTNQEILGLATAMSSVGIEAEAGKLFCPTTKKLVA